jgi:hypothetical protein
MGNPEGGPATPLGEGAADFLLGKFGIGMRACCPHREAQQPRMLKGSDDALDDYTAL